MRNAIASSRGPNKHAALYRALAGALALLAMGATNAFAQFDDTKFTANFGTDYSNGSYGTPRNTDVLMSLATLSAAIDDLKFSVSMPYLRISGRGLVVFDAAGNPVVINRRSTLPPDVRTGFGDVNLAASYAIPSSVLDGFDVQVTGRVKLPTASERKRLSTGQADYGISLDVSHTYGLWKPFVTVGFLYAGHPATFTLDNTVSVSAGSSLVLSDDLVAIASYDFDSSSTTLVDTSQEMFGSLSWLASDKITLTGYVTKGLSSGSPDIGGGLLVSYGFN